MKNEFNIEDMRYILKRVQAHCRKMIKKLRKFKKNRLAMDEYNNGVSDGGITSYIDVLTFISANNDDKRLLQYRRYKRIIGVLVALGVGILYALAFSLVLYITFRRL